MLRLRRISDQQDVAVFTRLFLDSPEELGKKGVHDVGNQDQQCLAPAGPKLCGGLVDPVPGFSDGFENQLPRSRPDIIRAGKRPRHAGHGEPGTMTNSAPGSSLRKYSRSIGRPSPPRMSKREASSARVAWLNNSSMLRKC